MWKYIKLSVHVITSKLNLTWKRYIFLHHYMPSYVKIIIDHDMDMDNLFPYDIRNLLLTFESGLYTCSLLYVRMKVILI